MTEPRRVLIVDDEEAVRQPLRLAFESEGWEVVEADSFERGEQQAASQSFQLALIDKNLPTHSGLELVRGLRDRTLETAVLMITGFPTAESAADGLNLGIDGYIAKPFDDIFEVVEKAHAAMGRREKRIATRQANDHFSRATAFLQGVQRSEPAPERPSVDVDVVLAGPDSPQRQAIAEQLAREGIDPAAVPTISALMSRVAIDPPDLVVLDLGLGEGEAIELVQRFNDSNPELLLVVCGPRPSLEALIKLIELRVHALLEFPFEGRAFADKIGTALAAIRRRTSDDSTLEAKVARL